MTITELKSTLERIIADCCEEKRAVPRSEVYISADVERRVAIEQAALDELTAVKDEFISGQASNRKARREASQLYREACRDIFS